MWDWTLGRSEALGPAQGYPAGFGWCQSWVVLSGVRPELVREMAVLLGKVRHLWRGLHCRGSCQSLLTGLHPQPRCPARYCHGMSFYMHAADIL